jgi:hypothetical protein
MNLGILWVYGDWISYLALWLTITHTHWQQLTEKIITMHQFLSLDEWRNYDKRVEFGQVKENEGMSLCFGLMITLRLEILGCMWVEARVCWFEEWGLWFESTLSVVLDACWRVRTKGGKCFTDLFPNALHVSYIKKVQVMGALEKGWGRKRSKWVGFHVMLSHLSLGNTLVARTIESVKLKISLSISIRSLIIQANLQ